MSLAELFYTCCDMTMTYITLGVKYLNYWHVEGKLAEDKY